jgi:Zn-dependent M16 (insulinase) family peptidase
MMALAGCEWNSLAPPDAAVHDDAHHVTGDIEHDAPQVNAPHLLLTEVALSTKFEDKARLKEIVKEAYATARSLISVRGNQYALRRASSYVCEEGAYSDAAEGIGYFNFLAGLEADFDAKADETVANLQVVAKLLFAKENTLVSFASDQKTIDASSALVSDLISAFPATPDVAAAAPPGLNQKDEGFMIPSQVNYVATAGNYRAAGFDYSGCFNVVSNIMYSDYLWNNVRVQGGAYGCMFRFSRSGLIGFSSFRDPNLSRTLDVYGKAKDYLANFQAGQREMTKFIIGAISDLDPALSPRDTALLATKRYVANISQEDVQREWEETLKTGPDNIHAFANLLAGAISPTDKCVIGGEKALGTESKQFRSVVNLLK